jgi:hypothetical protein
MSEHASPGISTKVDLGIADILRVPLDYIRYFSKEWSDDAKRRAQSSSLQEATDNVEVLRDVSAYLQQLRFDDFGVKHRILQYQLSPTRRNCNALSDALVQCEMNVNARKNEFLLKWNDQSTRRHVRADYPDLTKVIDAVYQLKVSIWEQGLSPQDLPEKLPLFRKRRLARITQSYVELHRIFKALNRRLDVALHGVQDAIAAYQARIDQLSRIEAGARESKKGGSLQ